MTKKQLPYNNSTLYYTSGGEGNTVVLLHGFAEDSSIWDGFASQLSTHYNLIIPDLPGTGKSTLPGGTQVGLEDYAESIHFILARENVENCCMIGHSMGGYIALAFAEKFPDMLDGIGLFHSSAYEDDEQKKATRNKAIQFIREKGSMAFLKTSIPGLFADEGESKNAIAQLIEKATQFSPEALIQYYQAMIARPDRTKVLKDALFPVLFMMGAHDKAVPFEQSLQQSYLPAQSHIHILRNSAHMGMLEESEKSFNSLAHFLHSVYV
jgi:pimeloyl-ACP methyl ester carboxylesterase